MKKDNVTKLLLSMIALLLLLNLMTGFFGSKTAQAVPEMNARGRYQITSWSAAIGTYGHHNGYYVLDTHTGKIVDSREEVHDITAEIPKTIPTAPKEAPNPR